MKGAFGDQNKGINILGGNWGGLSRKTVMAIFAKRYSFAERRRVVNTIDVRVSYARMLFSVKPLSPFLGFYPVPSQRIQLGS